MKVPLQKQIHQVKTNSLLKITKLLHKMLIKKHIKIKQMTHQFLNPLHKIKLK